MVRMSSVCELDHLVALLEEHGILSSSASDWGARVLGHHRIYEKVRSSPTFPLSVAEVQELLQRPYAGV